MQAPIEKGEQTKHAAEAYERILIQQLAQRRNRQGDAQEHERPGTRGVRNVLDWIGAKPVVKALPRQVCRWRKAQQKHGWLDPLDVARQLHSTTYSPGRG